MNKRGLSGVVTSLILILLVLVAVGIVWVVVKNIISEGSEQVSLGMFTVDLEIKNVKVNEGGVDVKVERKVGQGELTGIKFIISNGVNSETIEQPTTLGELGVQTFNLDYIGLVKEISVAPILELASGKEKIGNVADKFEFSNKEIIKNLGGVSWWRFEENANDEIGGNHGEEFGGVSYVEGVYGQACEFDGVDDDMPTSLTPPKPITVSAWIKINSYPSGTSPNTAGFILRSGNAIYFSVTSNGNVRFFMYNLEYYSLLSTFSLNTEQWYHITASWDGTTDTDSQKLYINGELDNSNAAYSTSYHLDSSRFHIGAQSIVHNHFNGIIDELIIFNRALSEEQVKALYELNLS